MTVTDLAEQARLSEIDRKLLTQGILPNPLAVEGATPGVVASLQ